MSLLFDQSLFRLLWYLHYGLEPAPTAEALLRTRYTAYSLANIDYIVRTMQGKAAIGFDANCLLMG